MLICDGVLLNFKCIDQCKMREAVDAVELSVTVASCRRPLMLVTFEPLRTRSSTEPIRETFSVSHCALCGSSLFSFSHGGRMPPLRALINLVTISRDEVYGELLHPQDVMSRHRGAKPHRRYGRSDAISLLSPEYLLSDELWPFHCGNHRITKSYFRICSSDDSRS